MALKLPIFVRWQTQALRLLVESAVPHLEQQAREKRLPDEIGILPDRTLSAAAAFDSAVQLTLESVLKHLSSLIETCCHSLADFVEGAGSSRLMRKRTPPWHESLKIVESHARTRAGLLPHWHEVRRVRADVNALKHADGTLPDPLVPFRADRVLVSASSVLVDIAAVEEWLLALCQAAEYGVEERARRA